jgi:hypothetical protein
MRVCLARVGRVFVGVLVLAGAFAQKTSGSDSKPSPWLTDYAQARKLAREKDKPLFVVFRCQH